MVKGMRKSIKVLFVLLLISNLSIPIGRSEEQYNHIWTTESPVIKGNREYGYQVKIDGDYINHEIDEKTKCKGYEQLRVRARR